MAVVGPTKTHGLSAGGALRLQADLAKDTSLANGNTYRARVALGGRVSSLDVRCKCAVTGGTPTVQVVAQTADINPPGLTVSDVTTGLTAATSLTNNTEALHGFTVRGEHVVDVVIDTTGAAAAGTVTYVDLFAKPI